MNFDFCTPQRIVLRRGAVNDFGKIAGTLLTGGNMTVFVSKSSVNCGIASIFEAAADAEMQCQTYLCPSGEPTVSGVDAAAAALKGSSVAVAVGGGSIIDIAKAACALAVNEGSASDYLEGVGQGFTVKNRPIPLIALPTTAGTGAEVTKNAVICDRDKGFKKSFRSEKLLPALVIIDPELSLTVPPAVTASCGMDAITQLIEAYISCRANPVSDAFAREGLYHIALKQAFGDCASADVIKAREEMSVCSLFSGFALASGGLGAAHGIASGIGAYYDIPHGLICGVLLPYVMTLNKSVSLRRLAEIGVILTGTHSADDAAADAAIDYIRCLKSEVGIPDNLSFLNLTHEDVHRIAAASMGGSMKGNPVTLTMEDTEAFIINNLL